MGFWDALDDMIDGAGRAAKKATKKGLRYAAQPDELVADSLEKGAELLEELADGALGPRKGK